MDAETYRKYCLERQSDLRRVLTNPENFEEAMQLFLHQHAMLHAQHMAGSESWSFEDEILDDLSDEQARRIPRGSEHSVLWCIWHIARIEDVAMNLLVTGSPQVFLKEDWQTRMRAPVVDTGNEMGEAGIAALNARIDFGALRAYRVAVGRRTRQIVQGLEPDDLNRKVQPERLHLVMDQGALVEAASVIKDYWGRRTIAGLLLMPASRHLLVHLNEALEMKKKITKDDPGVFPNPQNY